MARILTDDRPTFVRRSEASRTLSSNRADQELSVGLEAKKFLDSFFTVLNDAPSDVCDYYQIRVGDTSFSNNLNMQKHVSSATKFNKIKDFVMWGPKADKELEKREDDEREAAYTPAEQDRVILQGTIRPVVGDHVVLKSQGKQARLYQITNVDPQKLIDKPIYLITISPSPSFTLASIEAAVVATYKFVFGNIGSGRKTILSDTIFDRIIEMSKTLKDLNTMYVKTFYDEMYDILRYRGSGSGAINFVTCKSLREFQNEFNILRYGEDMNTLFVDYPFISDDDLKDYKLSYINKFLKRKIKTKAETPTPLVIDDPMDRSITFALDYMYRDRSNEENEMILDDDTIENFEPKYNLETRFYPSEHTEFSILTNFRKSDIVLVELNSRPTTGVPIDKQLYIKYEPKSKILLYILELYLDKNYDAIINTDILSDYTPSNNNIDDYLMLPLVMFAISQVIEGIEKDDLIVSF